MTCSPSGHPATFAVLLAGGSSTRWPNGPKLLARVDGLSLLARACRAVAECSARGAVVVLGAEAERLEPECRTSGIQVVHNPNYRLGQSTSLRVGVQAAPRDASGFLLSVADQPLLTHDHLDRLIAEGERSRRITCVRARNGKPRGAPAWFPGHMREELLSIDGDLGGRSLIEEAGTEVAEIALPAETLLDIDCPEDLDRLRALGHRCHEPTVTSENVS